MTVDNSLYPDLIEEAYPLEECIRHLEAHYTNLNSYEDGVPHHVKYAANRRIACAANRYGKYIVTGARHHDSMMRIQIMAIGADRLWALAGGRHREEQGFVDQWGIFLTREEAWVVAEAAGQIKDRTFGHGTLFSENYL